MHHQTRDGGLEFVLNHWKKGVIRQRFDWSDNNHAWQLVPAVHSMHPPAEIHEGYDYREHGFWHVARSQVMKMPEACRRCHQDDSCFLRGSVVEATFEPVFIRLSVLRMPAPKIWFAQRAPACGNIPAPPAPVEEAQKPKDPAPAAAAVKKRKIGAGVPV